MALDYGKATFGELTINLTSEASHRNNPYYPNQWAATGKVANGTHRNDFGCIGTIGAGDNCTVIWDFSNNEIIAAGNDADNLPFDDAHIFAVQPR